MASPTNSPKPPKDDRPWVGPLRGGPGKPPPLKDRLMAIFAGLCFMGCIIGGGSTNDKQWLAFFAISAVGFLMLALYFPAKSMDDPNHPDKDYDDDWRKK